jgi:hypothetical protein
MSPHEPENTKIKPSAVKTNSCNSLHSALHIMQNAEELLIFATGVTLNGTATHPYLQLMPIIIS